jgi:hypothetical protein
MLTLLLSSTASFVSLTNARPSAIYRVKGLRPADVGTSSTAILGIQITTLDALANAASTDAAAAVSGADAAGALVKGGQSGPVNVGKVAEKVVKNVRRLAGGRLRSSKPDPCCSHLHSCSIIYIRLKAVPPR